MFDTRKTGAKIMGLRKAKDMTQMELADLMQVSYQAVSNWERGNSMPDISKLADLARVLDVTIEVLLDSQKQAETVKRVMREEEKLTIKEIAEVAPILKPSKIEENLENANLNGLKLDDLIMIAPFLDNEDMLSELLQHVELSSIEDLMPFAPFLGKKQLVEIINQQDDLEGRLEIITSLAPFLDNEDLGRYAEEFISEDEPIDRLIGLAPFLDENCLVSLIEKIGPSTVGEIAPLAPFIKSDKLVRLVKILVNKPGKREEPQEKQGSKTWNLFRKKDDSVGMTNLKAEYDEDANDDLMIAIAPHLSGSAVNLIAKKLIEKGDAARLASLLPFLDNPEFD